VYKYRLNCLTEGRHVLGWGTEPPTQCFNGAAHTIDPASVAVVDEVSDARAVVAAKSLGTEDAVDVTAQRLAAGLNALHVSVADPMSATGEVLTSQLTPLIQVGNVYSDLNAQQLEVHTYDAAGGAASSVTSQDDAIMCVAGTAAGSYSEVHSRQVAAHQPGQSMCVRVAGCMPDGGVPGTKQLLGFGTHHNGLYVGYQGSAFGVLMRSGGKPCIARLRLTAAASAAGSVTVVLDGRSFAVPVTSPPGTSVQFTAFQIAGFQGGEFKANGDVAWLAHAVGDTVVFTAYASGVRAGAYSFSPGSTGASASFLAMSQGAPYTEAFTPRQAFSVDALDGTGPSGMTLTPTAPAVYCIEFHKMGIGASTFLVQVPTGGGMWVPFHRTTASLPRVPHGQITALCETFAPAAAAPRVLMYSGFAGLEGRVGRKNMRYSTSSIVALEGKVERSVVILRGRHEFNGQANVTNAGISNISMAVTSGNTPVTFRVYLNPTVSPAPSTSDFPVFGYISEGQSTLTSDVNSKTLAGGTVIAQYVASVDQAITITSDSIAGMELNASDVVAITAQGNNNIVNVVVSWQEDH
jgi:hypothetical protein